MRLLCPKDRLPLADLECSQGHKYLAHDGIPVLLRDDVQETIWTHSRSLKQVSGQAEFYEGTHGDYVSGEIASAGGYLYQPLVGNLKEYPIPELPVHSGGTFLDVGCNWGRWSIAAARQGFTVTGIDSCLDALLAAKKVSQELGADIRYICTDARYLPFEDNSFDQAFSFSVLQHFTKSDARLAFAEMKRVSRRGLVQMPGKYGVRALYHQTRRGFREPGQFDVTYWEPEELKEVGKIEPHAFFGTGILPSDVRYLPWYYKPIPIISDWLTRLRFLRNVADSYWVSF